MPAVPTTSPATGLPIPSSSSYIHTTSLNFVDASGRTLLLRGVNLSGASKAPVGRPSQILNDFWEDAERGGQNFVGRPLDIDDGSADVHLARLRGWGFNLLRFPFTWEALEHEGPGKYDYEFMDYTIRVLAKCHEYGFRVYMDPHQDTWSRFSGGSGAPFWTLAACGINPQHITATQAAILHCEYPSPYAPTGPDPSTLPAMVWSTNYGRLLSQTLFTLFFSGRDYAPHCIIDGVNIQDYLQGHYIEACGQLVDRIAAFEGGRLLDACVIGWDSMNEPFEGLCGWDDLGVNPVKQGSTLKKGTYPTPAQSVRLGMGQKQTVEHWSFSAMGPKRDGVVEVDPKGRKVWAEDGELPDGTHPRWGWKRDVSQWPLGTCIWALHGIWDIETGYVLRPDYFKYNPSTGLEAEFLTDYWKPHWLAYATRVRRSHPEAIVFVQPPVFAIPPRFEEAELKGRCAYSPHYYDGLTLVTRHWNWFNADALGLLRGKYGSALSAVKLGEKAIRTSLYEQLGYLKADVLMLGAATYPTLIGEIGTPFDMDGKRAYGWTDGGKYKGDYGRQEKALDASLQACDARRAKGKGKGGDEGGESRGNGESLNWTVWTYVPDDHSHEWGDGWNMEDLSLFSVDDLVLSEGEYESEEGSILDDDDEDGDVERREPRKPHDGDEYKDSDAHTRVLEVEDEDALHSRAVLLMDRHRDQRERERKGSMRAVMDSVRGKSKRRTTTSRRTDRQPARRPPMNSRTATSSAMSLDTLGGPSTAAASAMSLGLHLGGEDAQRTRQRRITRKTSASTLSSSSTSLSPRLRRPSSDLTPGQIRAGYSPDPYKFLTNGARAVRAFARPWPVKVVGRAVEVNFDVGKGVFKMVVSVGWEDRVRVEEEVEGDAQESQSPPKERVKLGTEVYIPLVHYAHAMLLEGGYRGEGREVEKVVRASGGGVGGASELEDQDQYKDDELSRSLSLSMLSASTAVEERIGGSSTEQKDASPMPTPIIPPAAAPAPIPTPTPAPLLIRDTPDLIDLEVKVSGGTYAVRGQTLVWWYDVPQEEEGRREYTLEAKRRGGALGVPPTKRMGEGVGGVKVNEGRRAKKEREEEERERERRGWCEEFCCGSFGCVVC
ncbi:hypothetical protein GALMADRAFT_207363 [Galerina marginata CBS 339.88]|uniref:Glycoside hydrolase family 5 domain-containing protein n=1 Tax=Galerina marginata (strain CBS 339.88) TaxID=685588 RepID=A0A067TFW1_GALM3|nr:hypothetical protein GALMADRAFT_207363 [Galerina marginata CBS 339.88]